MIYFLRNPRSGLVKIGCTINYHMRLSQLIAQHGDLELIGLMQGDLRTEKWLHRQFGDIHVYTPGQGNEWFKDTDVLRQFVRRHARMNIPEKVSSETVISVDDDVREWLGVLKDVYECSNLSDTLRRVICTVHPNIQEIAARFHRKGVDRDAVLSDLLYNDPE